MSTFSSCNFITSHRIKIADSQLCWTFPFVTAIVQWLAKVHHFLIGLDQLFLIVDKMHKFDFLKFFSPIRFDVVSLKAPTDYNSAVILNQSIVLQLKYCKLRAYGTVRVTHKNVDDSSVYTTSWKLFLICGMYTTVIIVFVCDFLECHRHSAYNIISSHLQPYLHLAAFRWHCCAFLRIGCLEYLVEKLSVVLSSIARRLFDGGLIQRVNICKHPNIFAYFVLSSTKIMVPWC